jgi:hypothetical protein
MLLGRRIAEFYSKNTDFFQYLFLILHLFIALLGLYNPEKCFCGCGKFNKITNCRFFCY